MSQSEIYAIIIIPIILSVLASLPGLLALRKNRNVKARERADTITALQAMIDKQAKDWQEQHSINRTMQNEIDALVDEVECWRGVFEKWRVGIGRLIDQIKRMDGEPEWQPEDDDLDCLKNTIAKGIKK